MDCPRCGAPAELYGLPVGIYGPSFKCYSCDPYGRYFTARTPQAYEACDRAKGASRESALSYLKDDE
jgi:hypothetical protein